MKIGGLQTLTLSDYPGHCAAIIFTIGCNFRCPYCHNKILWNKTAKALPEEQILEFLATKKNRLDGIVITGGEPTIQNDLKAFIQTTKKIGYKIKLDTNGALPEVLESLLQDDLLDYIAMDIKAPLLKYPQLAGVPILQSKITKSINLIISSGINHLFRTTWDKNFLMANDLNLIQQLLPPNHHLTVQKKRDAL